DLKPSSVMSWLLRRNSGVSLYLPNVSAHCSSFSGGTAPTSGCHSTIESPECVRRVMPPTTTIAKTSAQQARSHSATARGGSGEGCETIEVGLSPTSRLRGLRGPAQVLGLVELLLGPGPVEQVLDHRLHEFRTAVLVVEVIRVLPHVDR